MASATDVYAHESTTSKVPNFGTYDAAANTRYFEGCMVGMDASGRAYNYTDADASGFPCQGVAKHTVLNATGDAAGGLDGSTVVEVNFGCYGFEIVGTDPLPGQTLYVVDNTHVSLDSNNGTRGTAGKCFEVRTTLGVKRAYMQMGPTVALAGPGSIAEQYIPLLSFGDADGDPLAKFADGASAVPGFNLADSEAFNIRWNNHATPAVILTQLGLPSDLDESKPIYLDFYASKVGATVGDAVTFLAAMYLSAVGALHDADANAGGTSSAMTGNAATKTIQKVSLTIAAADVPAGVFTATLTIKPTDGTLGTDDVCLHAVKLRYTRK